MRPVLTLVLLLGCLWTITPASADQDNIVVVANTANVQLSLDREQVRNLFMGVAGNTNLKAVSLSPNNRARTLFNTKVLGLTESRIQSYWAQMRFSGRGRAPREFKDVNGLLAHIQDKPGTIAYLPGNVPLPDNLVVVYSTAPL